MDVYLWALVANAVWLVAALAWYVVFCEDRVAAAEQEIWGPWR